MKGQPANHPYAGFTVHKVFHRKTGRYYAVLVSAEHRTTIAYGKYILETNLGRKLREGFQAHHIDEDKLNDDPLNLEEKARVDHARDHATKPLIHGIPNGYKKGCRCAECKRAKNASHNKWRVKSKLEQVAACKPLI